MGAQAAYLYPNRVESERLVMFYRDLSDTDADIAEMDRHVSELERVLGRQRRSKIHWVRGSLLGQRNLSFLGFALGSEQSPSRALDRHEIAHAVLTQFRITPADPAMLLHEGWAESQSDVESVALARRALTARDENPTIGLVDLLGPETYLLDTGLAYPYGGAFIDFLLRNYSVTQFVDIYNHWDVSASDMGFRCVYGTGLKELEGEFWRDATTIARSIPIVNTEAHDEHSHHSDRTNR